MVDLLFIYLRLVPEMNSDVPFLSVYQCAMKLTIQAPNDFLRVGYYQKSEVPATNPPSYFKYDSPMKRLISLFRMNAMTLSTCSNLSIYNGQCRGSNPCNFYQTWVFLNNEIPIPVDMTTRH